MNTPFLGVVHPWLCDSMGHLTTRHYVAMFDDAHLHFFNDLGGNLGQLVQHDLGFADVKSTIEYRAELRDGDLVEIHSALLRLGNTSFTHRHTMRNRANGEVAATMENTSVCFDLATRKAVPLFDDFRSAAEARMKADAADPGDHLASRS